HADPVDAGLAWLESRQRADGALADRPNTAIRDTGAALRAFLQVQPNWPGAAAAREFLAAQAARNEDDRLRLAASFAPAHSTAPEATPLAGALASGWVPAAFDLALGAAIDADAGLYTAETRNEVLERLLGMQFEDGGFPTVANGAARLRAS